MPMVPTGYGEVTYPEGVGGWDIELGHGQSMRSPASTKDQRVYGPQTVRFERFADGGITLTTDMPDAPDFQGGRCKKVW